MNRFRNIFNTKCSVIGMIHLNALPGTPNYGGSVQKIVDKALNELDIYEKCDIVRVTVDYFKNKLNYNYFLGWYFS